jgi:hypothetical protein
MAIQSLEASNLCGPLGSVITDRTTLSFAPDELTTAIAYSSAGSIYTFYPYWTPESTDYQAASFGT